MKKMWEKGELIHRQRRVSDFPPRYFDISTKIVEKAETGQSLVLVVMLEVMSRTMPAILGSFFIRSSTLRMEESTVE